MSVPDDHGFAKSAIKAAGGVAHKYGFKSPYDLDDDEVKLVAYTIVSVQRGRERVMPGGAGTVVVTDAMTGGAFGQWRIAEYLDSESYTDADPEDRLRPGEEKDLRVDFVVSRRWPRQSLSSEKRKLRAIEGIRNTLEDLP